MVITGGDSFCLVLQIFDPGVVLLPQLTRSPLSSSGRLQIGLPLSQVVKEQKSRRLGGSLAAFLADQVESRDQEDR